MSEVETVERLAPPESPTESRSLDVTVEAEEPERESEAESEAETEAEVEEPPSPIPGIQYTYECINRDGNDFTETHSAPLDLQVEPDDSESGKIPSCVFELVTQAEVKLPRDASGQPHDVEYTLRSMQIQRLKSPSIKIHSTLLLEAIREVVKYYPSQNLIGDTVTIRQPYGVLMHHFTELVELKHQLKSTATDSEDDQTAEKCRHVQLLLDYLHPRYQQTIVPAQKRLAKNSPTINFADIWYLLKPGGLAYFNNEDVYLASTVTSVEYKEATAEDKARWQVKVCFMNAIWKKHMVTGSIFTVDIEAFDGEKVVTGLPIYPCHYYDIQDGGERREAFLRRGTEMMDILRNHYKYVKYDGKLMDDDKAEYEGPIIAGFCESADVEFPPHEWGFDGYALEADYKKQETVPGVVLPVFKRIERNTKETLSDDHLFLLSPVLSAFALSTKTWVLINVESIIELEGPETIPDANVDPEGLRIIKALSDRHINSKAPWSADFIKNKGEGVVVLLHGPPGVGKTYTVETIALSTGRPLIALTIGDLGTKEDSVEASLTKWFSFAHKWRAILLLDEADIFLERREHKDIGRNGIVSAFLRKMEYFGGLLFLTTNRVGHIDEAFISRVHVIIGFDKLDPTKRKMIWTNFLDKLHRERKQQIRVTPSGRNFALGDEMCAMEWNGREIRNALQTAIALAEYDLKESGYGDEEDSLILVEVDHFRRVMKMSQSFRAYMDSIDNSTEGARARDFYARNDYFRSNRDLTQ